VTTDPRLLAAQACQREYRGMVATKGSGDGAIAKHGGARNPRDRGLIKPPIRVWDLSAAARPWRMPTGEGPSRHRRHLKRARPARSVYQ
jgi:hypothetical protein